MNQVEKAIREGKVEWGKISVYQYPIIDGQHIKSITAPLVKKDVDLDYYNQEDVVKGARKNILEALKDERIQKAIISQQHDDKSNYGLRFYMCGYDGNCQNKMNDLYKENYNVSVF